MEKENKYNIITGLHSRPAWIKHEIEGLARSEPKPDQYGSAFSLFCKRDDGTEYQMDTGSERSQAFIMEGEEITESEYEKPLA